MSTYAPTSSPAPAHHFPTPKASSVIATVVVVGLLATLGVLLHLYVKNIAATTSAPIGGAVLALIIAGVVKHRSMTPQQKGNEAQAAAIARQASVQPSEAEQEANYKKLPQLLSCTTPESQIGRANFPTLRIPQNCDPREYLERWQLLPQESAGKYVVIQSKGKNSSIYEMATTNNGEIIMIPYDNGIIEAQKLIPEKELKAIVLQSLVQRCPPEICNMEEGRFFIKMPHNFHASDLDEGEYLKACGLYPSPGYYVLLTHSRDSQLNVQQVNSIYIRPANRSDYLKQSWHRVQGKEDFEPNHIKYLAERYQCKPMARPQKA